MSDLEGKIVMITGAGMGLGRAIALAFAEEGASVAICDINAEAMGETRVLIEEAGGSAIEIRMDVSDDASVSKGIEQIVSELGGLDVAVNNAALFPNPGPFHDVDLATYDKVMSVNTRGVWVCMQHQIARMLPAGKGAIVNITAVGSEIGSAGSSVYTASKHAILGLTRGVAVEYASAGIRINGVAPGMMNTPMTAGFFDESPEFAAQVEASLPIKRMCNPNEVANVVVFLASDKASYVIGKNYIVDGGMLSL